MAYATPEDVEARLGKELSDAEKEQIGVLLEDAELILRSRIPDLDEKIQDGDINEELLVMVECSMVIRVVRNPDGFTQESDGNYSYTISRDVASGMLEVLPNEWSLLGVRSGFRLIAPTTPVPWMRHCDDPNITSPHQAWWQYSSWYWRRYC